MAQDVQKIITPFCRKTAKGVQKITAFRMEAAKGIQNRYPWSQNGQRCPKKYPFSREAAEGVQKSLL